MADKKISALTAATTPLAGTEVLPIVQGGATVKVSAANITAGRDVSAKTLTGESNGVGGPTEIFARNTAGSERVQIISRNSAGISYIQTQNSQMLIGSYDNFAVQFMVNNSSKLLLDTNNDVKVQTGNLVVGTAGKGITTGGATALGFGVNNAVDAMTIDTSKNVGVGTASPAVKLHVSGTLDEVFRLTSTGSPYISWYAGVTRRGYIQAQSGSFAVASDTNIPLLLSTNSTERLRIKSTGGVRYVPLDAAPAAPDAGEVYYDNLTNKLRCYNGTTWNDLF